MVESIAERIESMSAITWAEANQAYLRTKLHRLRLLFLRKVRWLRQTWQQDPLPHHRSVVISDAHADRYRCGRLGIRGSSWIFGVNGCNVARRNEKTRRKAGLSEALGGGTPWTSGNRVKA